MSRPLRIELAGGIYHVTSRGDRREAIYLDDEDRYLWLEVFTEVCQRYNWCCHSWCLMTNHYHLVIECVVSCLGGKPIRVYLWMPPGGRRRLMIFSDK